MIRAATIARLLLSAQAALDAAGIDYDRTTGGFILGESRDCVAEPWPGGFWILRHESTDEEEILPDVAAVAAWVEARTVREPWDRDEDEDDA